MEWDVFWGIHWMSGSGYFWALIQGLEKNLNSFQLDLRTSTSQILVAQQQVLVYYF